MVWLWREGEGAWLLRGLTWFIVPRGSRDGWAWRRSQTGAGRARETVLPTWVIAGDSCGTAEDLPQQCRVLSAVLNEDILQGLCPVKLVEDDCSWGGRAEGWGGELGVAPG